MGNAWWRHVLRILFIGTVVFSYLTLEKIIDLGANVVGACTKKSSLFNADHRDLSPLCKKNDSPVKYVSNINSESAIDWIKSLAPDVIFCFGWSSLLKEDLLAIPKQGVIGYHPSLLPENRGRHPISWALVLGLEKTGSTFFFMDEGVDNGDILSQKEVPIFCDDDAGILYKRITAAALCQLEDFLPRLESGEFKRIKQDQDKVSF